MTDKSAWEQYEEAISEAERRGYERGSEAGKQLILATLKLATGDGTRAITLEEIREWTQYMTEEPAP